MSTHSDKYQHGPPPLADQMPAGVIISPDTLRANRLPPGQRRTRKWPVLHAGEAPTVDIDGWTLRVWGLVENELQLSWPQFQQLPRVKVFADFHCVERWSRLGNLWEGVATRELMDRAVPRQQARFVLVHAEGGWTTNLPIEQFLAEDVLLALKHDGEPLPWQHGGPVRLVVPRLYAWKSAKWVRGIELLEHDRPGYWEQAGYHMLGDPWQEQRRR